MMKSLLAICKSLLRQDWHQRKGMHWARIAACQTEPWRIQMNAKMTTIALAIIATSAAAFAADPAAPGKTRAEVRAELEQAYAQGQPGQAKEYAIERFTEHVKRFDQLAELATQETAFTNDQIAFLSGLRDRDNPFPDIDIYAFAGRQGHAEKRADPA